MRSMALTGTALDYAVAKALGMRQDGVWWLDASSNSYLLLPDFDGMSRLWRPSEDWGQAGPIIQQARISLIAPAAYNDWIARKFLPGEDKNDNDYDRTPLPAAMRCFVIAKLGYEVDIPAKYL